MMRYLSRALAMLVLVMFMASCTGPSVADRGPELKAAIIDQLYLLEPSQTFIEEVTESLESYGFRVDVWQGEDVTVKFYRELSKYEYKLIVFRAHSGLLYSVVKSQAIPLETTYLFSGETYDTTRYVAEQLTNRVSNALMTGDYPLVFAINSEFVRKNLKQGFDNTAIVMMGCHSHYLDDMATAFVQKGASVYLGWTAAVDLDYVDQATLSLIRNLCTENMTVARGAAETMTELGPDPYYHAQLNYYPASSGNQTIRELLK